jgi:hypothetical protein
MPRPREPLVNRWLCAEMKPGARVIAWGLARLDGA